MDKFEKVKIIAEKLKNSNYQYKNLYFRKDYNGFSGIRGKSYGSDMQFISWIISSIMLDESCKDEYFPDPGIAIFNKKTNKLIDKIYWYENPEKILEYFTVSKL